MDQTFFYVVGIGLVALALIISFVGMRFENFPSDGMRRAGVLLVALVVVVTGASAVKSAQDEEQDRADEQNREAATEEAQQTAENEEAGGGGSASSSQEEPATPATGPGDDKSSSGGAGAAAGAQVFVDNGCGSCHTLSAQGAQAVGTIGPNLDEALVDKDPAFIKTSIEDPSAEVEKGFGDGIMPSNFAEAIAPDDLDALVAYLAQATSGK